MGGFKGDCKNLDLDKKNVLFMDNNPNTGNPNTGIASNTGISSNTGSMVQTAGLPTEGPNVPFQFNNQRMQLDGFASNPNLVLCRDNSLDLSDYITNMHNPNYLNTIRATDELVRDQARINTWKRNVRNTEIIIQHMERNNLHLTNNSAQDLGDSKVNLAANRFDKIYHESKNTPIHRENKTMAGYYQTVRGQRTFYINKIIRNEGLFRDKYASIQTAIPNLDNVYKSREMLAKATVSAQELQQQ
jgi:hypothetical protein